MIARPLLLAVAWWVVLVVRKCATVVTLALAAVLTRTSVLVFCLGVLSLMDARQGSGLAAACADAGSAGAVRAMTAAAAEVAIMRRLFWIN